MQFWLRLCCVSVSVRPSHADLPWISTLPVPRKQLDEAACFSDGRHLLGPCERLSNNNPHMSHQLANQVGATQPATAEVICGRLAGAATAEQRGKGAFYAETPPCPHQSPTSHRKAHWKSNRRETSSDHSPPLMGPDSDPESPAALRRYVCMGGPLVDSELPSHHRPWCSWQKRGKALQELFALDQGSLLDQTIEEVSVRFMMSSRQHFWCLMIWACYLRWSRSVVMVSVPLPVMRRWFSSAYLSP